MSKKKKNQSIDKTITVGDIIGIFEGMDPNMPVAEGSFTISVNENPDMNVDYVCDCGCNCDNCDCDDEIQNIINHKGE